MKTSSQGRRFLPLLLCMGACTAPAPDQADRGARIFMTTVQEAAQPPTAVQVESADFGVRSVSVRPVAGGTLLYFRYEVVDAAKARPLFSAAVKPRLVDQASGLALSMESDTKLGALRSSPRTDPVNGKQYFVLFSNPQQRVQKGSTVDVALGDCTLKGLVVD